MIDSENNRKNLSCKLLVPPTYIYHNNDIDVCLNLCVIVFSDIKNPATKVISIIIYTKKKDKNKQNRNIKLNAFLIFG